MGSTLGATVRVHASTIWAGRSGQPLRGVPDYVVAQHGVVASQAGAERKERSLPAMQICVSIF
jgi:hypothetical protein